MLKEESIGFWAEFHLQIWDPLKGGNESEYLLANCLQIYPALLVSFLSAVFLVDGRLQTLYNMVTHFLYEFAFRAGKLFSLGSTFKLLGIFIPV